MNFTAFMTNSFWHSVIQCAGSSLFVAVTTYYYCCCLLTIFEVALDILEILWRKKKKKKKKKLHTYSICYLLTLLGTWSWCWQLLHHHKAFAATPTRHPHAHPHRWWWTRPCLIRLLPTTTMATPTSATSRCTPPVCSPSSPSNLFLNACMLPHDHLPRRLELPISIYKRYPTIPKTPQSLIPPPFVLEDYLIYSFWVRLLDSVPMLIMSM